MVYYVLNYRPIEVFIMHLHDHLFHRSCEKIGVWQYDLGLFALSNLLFGAVAPLLVKWNRRTIHGRTHGK